LTVQRNVRISYARIFSVRVGYKSNSGLLCIDLVLSIHHKALATPSVVNVPEPSCQRNAARRAAKKYGLYLASAALKITLDRLGVSYRAPAACKNSTALDGMEPRRALKRADLGLRAELVYTVA